MRKYGTDQRNGINSIVTVRQFVGNVCHSCTLNLPGRDALTRNEVFAIISFTDRVSGQIQFLLTEGETQSLEQRTSLFVGGCGGDDGDIKTTGSLRPCRR